MWLFTEIGFFSAVAAEETGDPTLMMVRGRVREDMERLRKRFGDLDKPLPEILAWPGRDYPYRVIVRKTDWAEVLGALSASTDYDNFKNRVKAVDGARRAGLYSRVWGIMYGAERALSQPAVLYTGYEDAGYEDAGYEDAVPIENPSPKKGYFQRWLRRSSHER